MRLRGVHPLACALLLVACTTLGDDASTVSGELGRGTFQYECDSSTRACSGASATVFPTRVAVDTRFGLAFDPYDDTVRLDTLESASDSLLEKRDYAWRALRPGTVGILSRPDGGRVEDYTFITLERATGVRFFVGPKGSRLGGAAGESGRPSGSLAWQSVLDRLELSTGAGVPLIAEPEAADGAALAGEPLLDFACDAAGIVELVRPTQRPDWFYLVGRSPGSTRCTLGALGFTRELDVEVSGTTDPPDDPDGGSDADADPVDAGSDAEVP